MRWPSQTGWLSRSIERLSSSLAKMCGSILDHVFCPSWERMVMSAATRAAALSMKRKAGPGGGDRQARRGRRSTWLSPSAPQPVVRSSLAGATRAPDDHRPRAYNDPFILITITQCLAPNYDDPWLHASQQDVHRRVIVSTGTPAASSRIIRE